MNDQLSDNEKLIALFEIIDDPVKWFYSLSYQQRIMCKGWLATGNRQFANALLAKMLPEQISKPLRVAVFKSSPNFNVSFG